MTSVLMAAAILLAAGAPASGDTVPAKARTLSDRGRVLYDAGDYASAITAFTMAYAMAPRAALLYNLAQAYRLQGNCDDAALMYRRYLDTVLDPQDRVLARAHLAAVEDCLRKRAGKPAIDSLVAPAAPDTRAIARRSSTAEIEKAVGAGLAMVGGVALAVAGYYAMQAHDAENDVTAAYARPATGKPVRWENLAPVDARGKTAASTAQLFGAGGALGVVGGVVMYVIGKHTERPPVSVMPTVHGVEVGMSWAF